jgi:hypothetical protein
MNTYRAPFLKHVPGLHQVAAKCAGCGGDRFTVAKVFNEQEFAGLDGEGKVYTHILRSRATCLECGHVRIGMSYEDRSAELAKV